MSDENFRRSRDDIHHELVGDETRADDIPPMYFLSQDDELVKLVKKDKDLKDIYPMFSPLTHLTKIDKKAKERWQIGVNRLKANMILHMEEDDYNAGKWRKIEAAAHFLKLVINDSEKGFKMTLLSRLRKEVVLSQEKKPGLMERIRRR